MASVFLAHNYYQKPGGEDGAFLDDATVLEQNGHQVHRYTAHNDDVKAMNKLQLARATVWNAHTYSELRKLFGREHFSVAHFHNTFPLISPSAYYAARDEGIPVVQTLHNFRLICPGTLLYRDGHVCEDCLGKVPALPSIIHACYHDSAVQTAVVALENTVHQARSTWYSGVDAYIATTEFVRQKFIQAGFPAEKIFVRAHAVQPDPGLHQGQGDYALYVGRLTLEKGIRTLLEAWRGFANIPLKIIGDGPLKDEVQAFIAQHNLNIELIPWLQPGDVMQQIKGARFLLFPSQWYETFGRVIIEAFACGIPVIASNLGAPAELVDHQRTGLHFKAGDAQSLAQSVSELWSSPQTSQALGDAAREEYERKYTAEPNYQRLMQIYGKVAAQPFPNTFGQPAPTI